MRLFSESARSRESTDINECLIRVGYAEPCEESYISQEDNKKRQQLAMKKKYISEEDEKKRQQPEREDITAVPVASLPPRDWVPRPSHPPSVASAGSRMSGRKVCILE